MWIRYSTTGPETCCFQDVTAAEAATSAEPAGPRFACFTAQRVLHWMKSGAYTLPTQIHGPGDGDISADEPNDRSSGGMVFEGEFFTGDDVDAGVFEDDGPFVRVVDAVAGVGGIVLVPGAGGGFGEVDDGILGNIESPVGAVGTRDDDGGLGGEDESGSEAQQGGGE